MPSPLSKTHTQEPGTSTLKLSISFTDDSLTYERTRLRAGELPRKADTERSTPQVFLDVDSGIEADSLGFNVFELSEGLFVAISMGILDV